MEQQPNNISSQNGNNGHVSDQNSTTWFSEFLSTMEYPDEYLQQLQPPLHVQEEEQRRIMYPYQQRSSRNIAQQQEGQPPLYGGNGLYDECVRMSRIEAAMGGLSLGNSNLSTPTNRQNPSFVSLNNGSTPSYFASEADYLGPRTQENQVLAHSDCFFNQCVPAYAHNLLARCLSKNPQYQPFAHSTSLPSTSNSYPNVNFASLAPLMNNASTSSSNLSDQAYRQPPRAYKTIQIPSPPIRTSSIEDFKGDVYLLAKHPAGCRNLQKIIQDGTIQEKQLILNVTLEHLHELIVHEHGTHIVQRLIEDCRGHDFTIILLTVLHNKHNILNICQDDKGTHAMQKLLKNIETPTQLSLILQYFRPITACLANHKNANHIIKLCFTCFPAEYMQDIANEILNQFLDISKDKYGCIVIQECLSKVIGDIKQRILHEIIANAVKLSEHPHGNYVVQYILGMEIPLYTTHIVNQLSGNYVSLSQDECGSHIVEKCILLSRNDQALRIIKEILNSQMVSAILQHPFGNYVAQTSLRRLKDIDKLLFTCIVKRILKDHKNLHSHSYGKRVFGLLKKMKQQEPPLLGDPKSQNYNII